MSQFVEVQSYWWVYKVAAAVVIMGIVLGLWQYVDKKKYLVGAAALFMLIEGYFMVLRLETRIDNEGIHYRMFPAMWQEHHIPWSDIIYISMDTHVQYSRTEGAHMYVVANDQGLVVCMLNGNWVLLGTRKPGEMKDYIMNHNPQACRRLR